MRRVSEFELPFRQGDSGAKYLIRGPLIDWGIILLRPGESVSAHYHNEVQEDFYFLSGKAVMVAGDRRLHAIPGDVYHLEPPERHAIINESKEDVKLVFIKAPYLPDDRVDA